MYAYSGEESGKRAKGVQKSVLHKTISFEDYKACLAREETTARTMTSLRSHQHHIFGETTVKTALSPFDSKRYLMADGVSTYPYGHKAIV